MQSLKIHISDTIGEVSALYSKPEQAEALLVLAHGAGAGMTHNFMKQLADALAAQNIATLRFNFPYMEKGSRRPDSPKVAHPSIVAAVAKGVELAGDLPVFASGKSFGGRMSSQAAANGLIPDAKGLIFFGFPLHAAGKPTLKRAEHLEDVPQPMLFLQGTRDTLAQIPLITEVCEGLPNATLKIMDGADHSFKMLKRSGVTQEEMIERLAKETKEWIEFFFEKK